MALCFRIRPLETSHYNSRITFFLITSCTVASLGGFLFGYNIGISGGMAIKEADLKDLSPWVQERVGAEATHSSNSCWSGSHRARAYTASLYVAGMLGALVAACFTHAFGRRPAMVAAGAAALAGSILAATGPTAWTLVVGRLLLWFGVGVANQAIPLYLSEIAPPNSRGAINHGFQLSFGMGIFTANLINYATQRTRESWVSWIPFAVAVPPAFSLMLGALLIPETPTSLIQQDKNFHDTVETLQKIRGTPDILAELNDIVAAGSTPTSFIQSLRKMIQRKYWPQLIMATAIPFFQQVTGFSTVAICTASLIRNVGFGENSLLMSALVIGLTSNISTILLMIVVDRVGRRLMFMVGGMQMLVSLVTVANVKVTELGRGYSYLALLLFCVYLMGFGWSWGPLGWLVPSEIFQLEIRSAAQSITAAAWFLFALLVVEAFPTMFCHLKFAMFFIFAIWIVVMTIFIYLFLPETGGIPLERMDRVWREHWFWKKIVEVEAA